MKKAIVTGGGGFVGFAVVKQLVQRGIEPVVIGRNPYPEVNKMGVRTLQGDIRDRDFLVKAFKGADTVFHVAAKAGIWGSWDAFYTPNVIGTSNVISACRKNNIPTLVYTSTPSVVFTGTDLCGVDETFPYARKFLCNYAHTKVVAEQMVLAVNSDQLRTTALRPHLVWGPGDTNLIPRLLDRGRHRLLKQVGSGGNLVDISYIDNVATAHLLAAENLESKATAAGRAYFISQGNPLNLWEWINSLFKRVGILEVEEKVSFKKAYLGGMILEGVYKTFPFLGEPLMTRFLAEQLAKSHWFSIDNAKNDLGYEPTVSTEKGMDRLVQWIEESGILTQED
ncbi:MAG: NAD-dependent epimerase/dehydratase family protein [Proteobacteria bacterium]|nr:NAD-dependent epimerase/dehydratase family protein [Pseudomonadota bacterium]MBU1710506.1 NAD-dependent epimerase/dehydratase family protein [Pseudomonadota bacterium]